LTDENYFLESVSQKAVQRFGLAVLCHSYAKQELEIWGKAQRESTWRPKSDWGKLGGGKISLASKSRGPNSNALVYAERALST